MPVLTRMLASPLFVDIRSGAVEDLSELLHDRHISTSGSVLIAVGTSQGEDIWRRIGPSMPDATVFPVGEGSLATAGELQTALGQRGYDAVVGIGGGRILDVAKYAATRAGVPMIAVATNLAHDGVCSPVASLEHAHGKGSFGVAMPLAVLIDLDYVRAAPAEMVRGGIGDLVSNISAIEDWKLGQRERGEPIDGLAMAFSRTAAESILHRGDSIESDDFLMVLAEALVMSGMAMSVAGTSRPCSGACHEILHAVDQLFPGVSNHGELAGLGALFATHLRGHDDTFRDMHACLVRHQLATSPLDVGLSREQFIDALVLAPSTRPERYTILEELDLDARQLGAEVDDYLARVGAPTRT